MMRCLRSWLFAIKQNLFFIPLTALGRNEVFHPGKIMGGICSFQELFNKDLVWVKNMYINVQIKSDLVHKNYML